MSITFSNYEKKLAEDEICFNIACLCNILRFFQAVERTFVGKIVVVFSSSEPLGSQGELIVFPSSWRPSVHLSVHRRSPFSKIFSETAWPIKAKFYVEPHGG